MENLREKPVIGLLGGIASGKSFVASQFKELGCAVITADTLAHEELLEEDTKAEILKYFGKEVFDEDGTVNRSKLAQRVFNDSDKLKILNSLIHPKVIEKTEALIDEYRKDNAVCAIVLDIPLLLEINWQSRCDALVFVDASEALRIKRALARGLASAEELRKREKKQISLDKKQDISHYVVDNNSNASAVANQVAQILSEILGKIH